MANTATTTLHSWNQYQPSERRINPATITDKGGERWRRVQGYRQGGTALELRRVTLNIDESEPLVGSFHHVPTLLVKPDACSRAGWQVF